MTITNETYIQEILDSDWTVVNPEFTITFPVYNEDDLWVWTKDVSTGVLSKMNRGSDYEVRVSNRVGTLVWIGQTPHYADKTIKIQRHMRRVQQDEYRDARQVNTESSLHTSLDKTVMKMQQSLEVDSAEPYNWSAKGDRLGDVSEGTTSGDVVTKSQVDSTVGGGTSPFVIASEDVGKYKGYKDGGTYTYGDWYNFNSLANPKGKEFMYYTAAGWVDISGNLPDIAGTADNDKVLMDISGTPTWTMPREVQTTFDDTPSNKVGKVYSIDTYSDNRISTVRDYSAAPELLPNVQSQRLVSKETDYSGASNKVEFGRFFKITTHTVTCSKRTGTTHYNGLSSTTNDTYDHPVYIGQVDNITEDSNVAVFFCSHAHAIPDDGGENGMTGDRWWAGPAYDGSNPNEAMMALSTGQSPTSFSFIINTYEVDATYVKFSAASILHESFYTYTGMSDWDGWDPPDNTGEILRNMKHPDSMDISFNILWFLQK